jgi:hypothetical protein
VCNDLFVNAQGSDSADTRSALLKRCRRDAVPIRRSFVQDTAPGGGPGPLAAFVRRRRATALDLYLLFHASACGGAHDTRLHAAVWARGVGLRSTRHSETVISRNWAWLNQQKLIAKQRDHRLLRVVLLQDDGSGAAYVHPGQGTTGYFKLSHSYWLDGWCDELDLASKAALLILLSRRPGDDLPQERVPEWYGVSADSFARGVKRLETSGLLRIDITTKKAPLSPLGYTWEHRYTLLSPFARATPSKRKRRAA